MSISVAVDGDVVADVIADWTVAAADMIGGMAAAEMALWYASNSCFRPPIMAAAAAAAAAAAELVVFAAVVVGQIVSQGIAAPAAAAAAVVVPSIMALVAVASLAPLLSASSTPSAISDSHPDSSMRARRGRLIKNCGMVRIRIHFSLACNGKLDDHHHQCSGAHSLSFSLLLSYSLTRLPDNAHIRTRFRSYNYD